MMLIQWLGLFVQDVKKDGTDNKLKARPAPKTNGSLGVNERPQTKVTMPVAPHFASEDRIRERNLKKAQSASSVSQNH